MSTSRPQDSNGSVSSAEEKYASALKFIQQQSHRSAYAAHEFFAKQTELQQAITSDIPAAFKKLSTSNTINSAEKRELASLEASFATLQPTLQMNPFTTPAPLSTKSFVPHAADASLVAFYVSEITGPFSNAAYCSSLLSATAALKQEVNDPSILLLTALKVKYGSTDIQNLSNELIKPQQNMARYELLLKSLKDPLEEIINHTDSTIQELSESTWAEKDNAIHDLEMRRNMAISLFKNLQSTYTHVKQMIGDYNNQLKVSPAKDAIQSLLSALSAEKDKLLRSEDPSAQERRRLEAITRMTDIVIDALASRESMEQKLTSITEKIHHFRSSSEFKDVLQHKEARGFLNYFSRSPRKETKLWAALENFPDIKSRGPASAPAVMERVTTPKSSTSHIGTRVGISTDIVGGLDEDKNPTQPLPPAKESTESTFEKQLDGQEERASIKLKR